MGPLWVGAESHYLKLRLVRGLGSIGHLWGDKEGGGIPQHTHSEPSSLLPQNIPTLGTVAVTMALHSCDQVAVAGFGYDMSSPNAPLHYYESVRMAAIKEVGMGRS